MKTPLSEIRLPTAMRRITKADYAVMYSLLEKGVTREQICKSWGIKDNSLYKRVAAERPDLIPLIKKMNTGLKIPVSVTLPLEKIIEGHGKRIRGGATKLIAHDIDVLASRVDKQRAAREKDPNKELTTVALQHAADLHSLMKTAAMIPHTGVQGTAGASVTVNTQVNHAVAMRVNGAAIFASEEEIPADAFVQIEEANRE